MKTKTIVTLSVLLLVVNVGLGATIYFLVNPTAKEELVSKLKRIDVPQLPQLPDVPELPKIEVTEEDVETVKENVKTKLYERAQLTEEGSVPVAKASDMDDLELESANQYVVDAWGLTFHFPDKVSKYEITMSKDVLTIERHLQVLAYIARYDAGVKPSIGGHWELLASYNGSDYYMRKGDSVVSEDVNKRLEAEREELYNSILTTYHFMQE